MSSSLARAAAGVGEPARSALRRGISALDAGALGEARRAFAALLEEGAGPADAACLARAGLAAARLAAGQIERAGRELEPAGGREASCDPLTLARAVVAHRLGQHARAWELLAGVAPGLREEAGGPAFLERVRRARSLELAAEIREARAAGELRRALDALGQARALDPDDAELLRGEAALALDLDELGLAEGSHRELVQRRPEEVEGWLGLGRSLALQGKLEAAREAYERAAELPGGRERAAEALRAALAGRGGGSGGSVELGRALAADRLDRAGLAIVLRSRLPLLARMPPARRGVILSDVAGSPARQAIQELVALGVLEAHDNHAFRPEDPVTRAGLALAASRVLGLLRAAGLLAERRASGLAIPDVAPEHLAFPAVRDALRYGVLDLDPDGNFAPGREVSGREAGAMSERLAALAR